MKLFSLGLVPLPLCFSPVCFAFCILFQFNTNTLCTSISTREIVHLKINKKHLVILPIVPLHLALLTSTSTHNNNNNNHIFTHMDGCVWTLLTFDLLVVGCPVWLSLVHCHCQLPTEGSPHYTKHIPIQLLITEHKNDFLLFLKTLKMLKDLSIKKMMRGINFRDS